MGSTARRIASLFSLLLALMVIVASCASDDDGSSPDTSDPGTEETTSVDSSAPSTSANRPSDDGEPFRIAVVAPSASDDVAFTQSMVDAVNTVGEGREVEFAITDGKFVVDDGAAAIRGYAEDGFDLVVAHGNQYDMSVREIAQEFPDVTFAWGTGSDTFGLPNVYTYTVRSDEGGYVLGTIAAQVSQTGVIGVIGPVAIGDAALYIDGFVAGATEQDPAVTVDVEYIESFSDVTLAAEAATTHLARGADTLTGSAQMVVGATGVAAQADAAWFGNQSNQTELGPDFVVASQVYHWEVLLDQIIDNIEAGVPGGDVLTATLANGGIVIEYNDGYPLDSEVRAAAETVAASMADGSITTGVEG